LLCRKHELCTTAADKNESTSSVDNHNASPPSEPGMLEPREIPWYIPRQMLGIKSKKREKKQKKSPTEVLSVQSQLYWYPPPDQTVDIQGVKVPRRKKRDSLSVLNALASTVEKVDISFAVICYSFPITLVIRMLLSLAQFLKVMHFSPYLTQVFYAISQ